MDPRQPNDPLTLPNDSKVSSVGQRVVSFPYTLAESFSK